MRWDWCQKHKSKAQEISRNEAFNKHATGKFLRATIKIFQTPLRICSAMMNDTNQGKYLSNNKLDVQVAVQQLLDNWVPPDQQTQRPRHLDTKSPEDLQHAPAFVREMIMADINRENEIDEAFMDDGHCTWNSYEYDTSMQQACDRRLSKHVSPGHGGVSQEMWVAAPAQIRTRERKIINLILRTSYAPTILKHRQLVFLLKKSDGYSIVNLEDKLPPWRPIMVQPALASRIGMVVRDYVGRRIPNHELQFGFKSDRIAHDAALLTRLIWEMALEKKTPIFLVSKDCEKCFDRVTAWVMEYIYLQLGVPPGAISLMMNFLAAGQVDIKTSFGWLDGGVREFGLGQGSIYSVLHIVYFFDVLQRALQKGTNGVEIKHHQNQLTNDQPTTIQICSHTFVDDTKDIATTYEGIKQRIEVSNMFTGINGTGSVYNNEKSFFMYYDPQGKHYETIQLHNGLGIPKPITLVAPNEGFKDLGIQQGTGQWLSTTQGTYNKIEMQAKQVQSKTLHRKKLQYIANGVWDPSMEYRGVVGDVGPVANAIDILKRKVARSTLRLSTATPNELFHDTNHGINVGCCQAKVEIARFNQALRILNGDGVLKNVLLEWLETYQTRYGLANHPFFEPVLPPISDDSWIASIIRIAAKNKRKFTVIGQWKTPPACKSRRARDVSVWPLLTTIQRELLLKVNVNNTKKLRYIGDICNDTGTHLLQMPTIANIMKWDTKTINAMKDIVNQIPTDNSGRLLQPLSRTHLDTIEWYMPVTIQPEQMVILACHRTTEDGTDLILTGYQIAERVSNVTKQHELGTEIKLRGWSEKGGIGSGIWYAPTPLQRQSVTKWELLTTAYQLTQSKLEQPDKANGKP